MPFILILCMTTSNLKWCGVGGGGEEGEMRGTTGHVLFNPYHFISSPSPESGGLVLQRTTVIE